MNRFAIRIYPFVIFQYIPFFVKNYHDWVKIDMLLKNSLNFNLRFTLDWIWISFCIQFYCGISKLGKLIIYCSNVNNQGGWILKSTDKLK